MTATTLHSSSPSLSLPPSANPQPLLCPPPVRRLMLGDDISRAVDTLASSFSLDPLLRHIYGISDPTLVSQRNKALFRSVLTYQLSRRDGQTVVHTDATGSVVAVWQENGAWRTCGRDILRVVPGLLRAFGLNSRARSVACRLESQHPQGIGHVHLQFFGARKGRRDSEEATAVMKRMLDRLDVERMPAYVESANEEDVQFYRRFGFEVVHQVEMRKGAPKVVGMWRTPQV